MNIVNKLTLRHLKQNKRRTLVTVIGVIISVAMITAVSTLGVSFLDLFKRQVIATEGEWHVSYENINKEQAKEIRQDDATKALILSRYLGYSYLKGSENRTKPYVFVRELDDDGLEYIPIELSRGRLPKAGNEIILSEDVISSGKVTISIGDSLKLEVGERILIENENSPIAPLDPIQMTDGEIQETINPTTKKEYTVVGFMERPTWERAWTPGYSAVSYIDQQTLTANDYVNGLVVLNEVNRSLYSHAESLAKDITLSVDKVSYNNELLRYYGVTNDSQLQTTIVSLSAIIMLVIMVGSIALIYNAFAISVSERARHLGMLASVGATKSQKRNSVLFEGVVIGILSIPIGIISGLVGIGITFWFINSAIQGAFGITEQLELVVTPLSILAACGVSMLTILVSTYLPARKASKISAIDAIRQTQDVKLSSKKVKTSRFVRKLFGMEAEIGLKNLKRNKRRYQATVLSLVISIVLFLTVSYFTINLEKSAELSQDGVNFDLQVASNEGPFHSEQLSFIETLENVTDYAVLNEQQLNAWINEEMLPSELQESITQDDSLLTDGKYPYYINIQSLDDQSLSEYAKLAGVDVRKLKDPDNPAVIVVDQISYRDYEAKKFVETEAIHAEVGQSLELVFTDWETNEESFIGEVEIAGLTDQVTMGTNTVSLGGLNMVVSEQVLEQLVSDNETLKQSIQSYLYLTSTDPIATQQEIEEIYSNVYIYNVYQAKQQEEQLILILSVFTYGFIVLITAISIANIFNTISTSIALRKREFAMLKSVGMTPKGFNKMVNYESIFYGIKSLVYGLPLSIIVMYLIYRSLMNSFEFEFALPWLHILYVVIAIFVIVGSAMLYSVNKVRKENIIDALKQENI